MLQQLTHSNGVTLFRSPLLVAMGVPHGFSTRIGGVSTGIFSALNLGNNQTEKDTPENLQSNFRLFQQAIGTELPRAWVTQVHGNRVELIAPETEGEYAETLDAEIRDRFSGQLDADALVATISGVLLTVRIADCVPILLAGDQGRIVAAVHAGWRGTVAGVLPQTIELMRTSGAAIDSLAAAIGPGISAEQFEVGPEVADAFSAASLAAAIVPRQGANPHINLQHALSLQLQSVGISRIDTNNLCTFRDTHLFFSHRRENGHTGRMAAAITAK